MLTGADDSMNLCSWKKINTWLRIMIASVVLLDAVLNFILVMAGMRETVFAHNARHNKVIAALAIMSLLDFSDFYTGWTACYAGELISGDRRTIEECLYWPWLPVIITNVLLIMATETMFIIFNFYGVEIRAKKRERDKFKRRLSYEDAAAKDVPRTTHSLVLNLDDDKP